MPFTLRDLLLYFLRLGTFGFGGPIALAGYMQRELVEGRRWVSHTLATRRTLAVGAAQKYAFRFSSCEDD